MRDAVDGCAVRAPSDGVVLAHEAVSGQLIFTGQPIVEFAPADSLELVLGFPLGDAATVRTGDLVDVTVDGLPGVYHGGVATVGQTVSPAPTDMVAHDIHVMRTVRVVVEVTDPTGHLKSGMPADAVIHSSSKGQGAGS